MAAKAPYALFSWVTDLARRGLPTNVDERSDGSATGSSHDEPSRPRHPLPDSLEEVYRAHAGFVWRQARKLGIPEAMVEDVMHDVFLVLHRRWRDYDGRAAMTTWLYEITRGVVSNTQRGRRRELLRIERAAPRPASPPDPATHAEHDEAARFLEEFLPTLDPDKRRIFELVELEGLRVPEAAELCRVKLNTAYSRLRAARRQFQQAVDRLGSPPHDGRRHDD